jgi:hypothetical protein
VNRRFGSSAVVLILATLSASASEPTPWETYLSSPTPANAAKVKDVSYGTQASDETVELDLMLLQVQVQAGDRAAIGLAFRLLVKSDGHRAESLCIMLGRIIRPNPAMFLRELRTAKLDPTLLGSLVGDFGPEYVDRTLAHLYEARQRIAALRTVNDPELHDLRESCIKELQ